MKKWLVKAIGAVLCASFTATLVGCNDKTESGSSSNGSNGPSGNADLTINELTEYDGLHIYNKTVKQGEWLLKEGKTQYTLVLPDSTQSRVSLARTDFQELFLEATGVRIKTAKENEVTSADNGKYIFIGCTETEQMQNLSLNDGLPAGKTINNEGFRIKTVGDDIFVMARNEKGALWGTYELLTQLFNYERYWVEYYEIDKVTEVPLYDFDVIDNPDFETRIGPWGAVYQTAQATNANRMRFSQQHSDVYVGKTRFHNTLDYLPPETYMAENREWYAQYSSAPVANKNVLQLCYTAHGDAVKYEAMVTAMANACIEELKLDTVRPVLTITQEDNREFCTCEACEEGNAKYGGNLSGNMWKFHLKVVRKINEWLDKNQPGRKDTLRICMFAYQNYQQAPAYKDANGVWKPYESALDATNDPTVSNAAIFFAMSSADLKHALTDEEYGEKEQNAAAGWKVCTNHSGVWMYQTNYKDYLIPTESFSYQQNYRFCLDFGAKWIFDQGQQGNLNSTAFNDFKLYLNSKLQWNVNLDMAELEDKYFNAMYGPASDIMNEYYLAIRAHMQTLPPSEIEESMSTVENFPYNVVKQWLGFVDRAYEAIEPLKTTNPVYYQQCYDHICTESITARYLLIKFHESSISAERLAKERASFKEDVTRLNITEYAQHQPMSDLVKDW